MPANAAAERRTRTAARRRLGIALLAVAGLAGGLAVVEALARLPFGRENPHRFYVRDAVLHHRLRPSASKSMNGVEFQGIEYRTNSLGLRDREYPATKPPGTVRILMLGDSFTEGVGLRIEETVAKQLEAALNARGCGRRYEVVNAGTGSYSPILEYLLLQHVGLGLHPDLVVLNFDMTDVHDDWVRTRLARLDADGLPLAVPHNPTAEAAVLLPPITKPRRLVALEPLQHGAARLVTYQALRKSTLGQRLLGPVKLYPEDLASSGLAGDVRYDILAITRDGHSPALEEAWALTRRYVAGIAALARRHGAGFVLTIPPHAHQVSALESPAGRRQVAIEPGFFPSERPFRILEDLGRSAGFPVINLLDLFRRRSATEGLLFWLHDIHQNPRGARVFAEGTLDGLLARGLVGPCDRPR